MSALLTSSLQRFYEDPSNANVLESIITGKSEVSLRLVEWYVANGRMISIDYHAQLRAYTRRLFDPFRRSQRTVLSYEDRSFETTLGQMNFFKWLIEEGHWAYLVANKSTLNDTMVEHMKARKNEPKSAHQKDAHQKGAADDASADGMMSSRTPKTLSFN